MPKNLKHIISAGWTNLKRNSYLSFGTIGVMVLALILFLGLLSFQYLATNVVSSLEQKIDISAYFKADAGEDQILKVQGEIKNISGVSDVKYISKDQALADFKARHSGNELIKESLAQLDTNPLAASLNIKTRDSAQYASIAKFLEDVRFKSLVDKVNFYENKDVIEKIQNIANTVRSWGLAIVLLIALIAVLITFNTIRLTIYNQKQEIEIMRLVGASNWHIRGPYLVEGGFYGLFSALIAMALFYPGIYFASDKISSFEPALDIFGYMFSNLIQVFLLTVFLGIALGTLSSTIAIRRHLKV